MRESLLRPSHETAKRLRQSMRAGIAEPLNDGVVRIMASNAKDYTGPGTNTYLVGQDALWVIDPGPDCNHHIDAVLDAIGDRPVLGIFVTHSHLDHSPAARPLKDRFQCPVYGMGGLDPRLVAASDEDIDPEFAPDVRLQDQDRLESPLGAAIAIHTPGHFPNHLCLYFPEIGALFTGDHVMGWSTTVIVPPLGHLGAYLDSLGKLKALDAQILFPSHGEAVEAPRNRIEDIEAHRRVRHRQVHEALMSGLTEPSDIVDRIYEELPPRLRRAAEGQVQAHLDYLETEASGLLKTA